MLSNAYFLAKFRFDTAENEPAKNLQNFVNFPNFANPNPNGTKLPDTIAAAESSPECSARYDLMRLLAWT